MLVEQPRATTKRPPTRMLWVGAAVVLALLTAGIVILATHWPFTREAVTKALEEALGRPVQIGTFSQSYFPPGCTAGDIRFLRHKHPQEAPIITVQKIEIQGSLTGLFGSPRRLDLVRVVGMHMIVPPGKPDGQGPVALNAGPGGKSLAISKVTADGAILEFLHEDRARKPYVLKIDRLALTNIGSGDPMYYRATLSNTEPPGIIVSGGKFGPWNPKDIGSTAVSGSYTYDRIDLNHFQGIYGTGHASGRFSGQLSRIETDGSVDVPAFRVEGSDHTVPLSVTYKATVNGTNGDVLLNPATAHYRHTEVEVRGPIAALPGEQAKSAVFDLTVPQGRVDDLLYLFSRGQPGMSGAVALTGKFVWPPGPRKFLEKIRIELSFGMKGSRFTSGDTQDSVNRISESAQGEKKKQQDEDPQTVLGQLQGNVSVQGGVASITNGQFQVPGAGADIHGSYNLLNRRVDLHGTLDTRGNLSDTQSGFKALVLKVITPLFKKKGKVRIVPFRITGSYGDTTVGLDLR